MARITRTFTKSDYGFVHTSDAYTDDGRVWRWVSNNAVAPLDACREYGIPCDAAAQEAARTAEVDAFLAEYRQRMADHVPSAEERGEMRAAFGPGVTVVNVITGRKYRT